ncbi:DUF1801 domain-containing protein [Leptospira idonii]|uniref:DUF1801 domain-containing protein n=1 Tax=Leptospira idonii TaxID=1193500 RepID=A0A4R9M5J2_9LEPT|nr:DUF1801 domain-containing protein [Leptospira idonii]TGN19998.1 DUF1801 domain-containing protein [Leptospira idonii]
MAKAEQKTKETQNSVVSFLNQIKEESKRTDCFELVSLMEKITKEKAKLWGTNLVGFGNYHYVYESGHEGDSFLVGFSPRSQNLTLYIMAGFETYESILKDLGKFKTGKSCLYIKKLEDIDRKKLKELITNSVSYMKKKYKK